MKQTLTTLLIFFTVGLMSVGFISCRKDNQNVDIKTYDTQQIEAYIQGHNLTGYTKGYLNGDTTGIYYKIIKQGSGPALDYPDKIFFVYSANSLDGKFLQADTVINHIYNFLGHISPAYTLPQIPYGVQLAIKNILKYRGTQAHVIIPSRLAFGSTGVGTGSTRLPGNESLDYYINLVDPAAQPAYDDLAIKNYMTAHGLSGFTKTASGLYYKVTQAGTGTTTVTPNSTIGLQFTGRLLDTLIFDQYNGADATINTVRDYSLIPAGWQEGFKYVTPGAKLTLLMPTSLGFGALPSSAYGFSGGTVSVPPNSALYYEFNIISITN